MRLIIDIPEEVYESRKRECEEIDDLIIDTFTLAIGNGTPLDDVKAEILKWHTEADLMYVGTIIEILDNIDKAERE